MVKLPQEDVDLLMEGAERGSNATITIDLEAQEITSPDGNIIKFEIDPFKKYCLINGLDDISLTMEKDEKIVAFEKRQRSLMPWAG